MGEIGGRLAKPRHELTRLIRCVEVRLSGLDIASHRFQSMATHADALRVGWEQRK
jgi:hypothetical protein